MIEIRNFIAFRGKKSNMKGSDEGLMLETSDFKLFTVANARYELSW